MNLKLYQESDHFSKIARYELGRCSVGPLVDAKPKNQKKQFDKEMLMAKPLKGTQRRFQAVEAATGTR